MPLSPSWREGMKAASSVGDRFSKSSARPSRTSVREAPAMAKNSFPAGFRVRLHDKDLRICRDMAARRGAVLPVVESTLHEYEKLIERGFGDEDISSIYRLKSALFPKVPTDSK